MKIGILHPGEMGISVCRAVHASGHEVLWCSEARSRATLERASSVDAMAIGSLEKFCRKADGIISVCPPHAAQALAKAVASTGYEGIYLDANAVSPATAESISEIIGPNYVDGGIIGPPANDPGSTRMYVSGNLSDEVVEWLSEGNLEVIDIGKGKVRASTLKMAYAAYTKGSSALILAVNALAEAGGVRDELVREWSISQPGLDKRSDAAAKGSSRKAWRFVGEMAEIAVTFEKLGLPGGFHQSAGEIYRRMADLKDLPASELDAVLNEILDKS